MKKEVRNRIITRVCIYNYNFEKENENLLKFIAVYAVLPFKVCRP